jgi:hypothetical protein
MVYLPLCSSQDLMAHGSNINEPTPMDRKRPNHKEEASYGFHGAP